MSTGLVTFRKSEDSTKMKVGEQAVYLARLKGISKHEAIVRLKMWFEKFEIEAWWDKK